MLSLFSEVTKTAVSWCIHCHYFVQRSTTKGNQHFLYRCFAQHFCCGNDELSVSYKALLQASQWAQKIQTTVSRCVLYNRCLYSASEVYIQTDTIIFSFKKW